MSRAFKCDYCGNFVGNDAVGWVSLQLFDTAQSIEDSAEGDFATYDFCSAVHAGFYVLGKTPSGDKGMFIENTLEYLTELVANVELSSILRGRMTELLERLRAAARLPKT